MSSRFTDIVDRDRIEQRLLRYVGIHSVNPALDGGPGEASLATAVHEDLAAMGFAPERQVVHPGGRDNIVLSVPGRPGSPTVMFQAHMDTVGLSGTATADPHVADGNVYGRGACDTKGSLVAMVEALALLKDVDPTDRANLVFCGGIDEEVTGDGARELVAANSGIDMAVVGEPTGLEMATAHKGVLRFEIRTIGMPAHSSKPHLGVNAIYAMAKVVDALVHDYIPRLSSISHALAGSPTLNVSTIRGGTADNVVPAECVISIDRRVVPGEDHEALLREFDELLDGLRRGGIDIERSEPSLATAPLDTRADHPVVVALGEARRDVLGAYGDPIGVTYGTDGSFFGPAGIPCVVFGPGSIDQAHSDEEWVGIDETARAAEILAQTALNLAG